MRKQHFNLGSRMAGRDKLTTVDAVVSAVECPTCLVAAGAQCVFTAGYNRGQVSSHVHDSRVRSSLGEKVVVRVREDAIRLGLSAAPSSVALPRSVVGAARDDLEEYPLAVEYKWHGPKNRISVLEAVAINPGVRLHVAV